MRTDTETSTLVDSNKEIQPDSSACSFYLMILFPAWACIIFGYIMLSLVISNQLQDFKDIHDKNITVIEPWVNGTHVVHCSPENPCFVTCYDFVYRSEECEFNFIWVIICGIILGTCSCVLLIQICKYGCGYICYKFIHKKSTTSSTTKTSSTSSSNNRYGRV